MEGIEEIRAALGELAGAARTVSALDARMRRIEALVERTPVDERDRGEAREARGDGYEAPTAAMEIKALAAFARSGAPIETRMDGTTDAGGGYTVIPAMSDAIQRRLFDVSPMARLARRVTIGDGGSWEELRDLGDYGATWVGETAARPETTGGTFTKITIDLDEIYANAKITQRLLDDSAFDLGAWVTERVADKFARSIGAALVSGDGTAKPKGLLTYPTAATADDVRAFGTIEHIPTGSAGALSSLDVLIDTAYRLKSAYRPRAVWTMNARTAAVLRKMKTSDGDYIWAETLAEGSPARLLGYPVYFDESLPDIGEDALAITFGDYSSAYAMVTRPGLRILRDPYTEKPFVYVYCTMRVGGGLIDSEAVKLVKFAAT